MEKPMPLPIELVLHVITCTLPKRPTVILAPSHPITQTLLSFTLVCHETRRVARRYLVQYCFYLSSSARLRSFLRTVPERPTLNKITALSLAPFADTIDDNPTAVWVRELFNHTCTTLKRLVIDIPLRSVYPEDDHLGVRKILREGFARLENLEEFTSVRDELFLDVDVHDGAETETQVWTLWPKLRRLALYNVAIDGEFWQNIAELSDLETLILTRADCLREINIKVSYFRYCDRPLKLLLVNVEQDQVRFANLRRKFWDRVDREKKMTIMTYDVPCGMFEEDDPIETCQDYVRTGAENGTLWHWEGETIQHRPRLIQLISSGA